MIGKKAKIKGGDGTHFYECLKYNAREKNKAGVAKCEWVEYRNLNSNDHLMAAHEMMMTAEERRANAEEPLFHYVISWDTSDDPTKEQMLEVADQWLEHMGLEYRQVQIASHVDTQKPHIHLAINRVHPVTHNSWNRWNYKTKSETLLKELEREFGWKIVPGKHHPEYGVEIDGRAPEAWEIHAGNRKKEMAAGMGVDPESIDGRSIIQRCDGVMEELFDARSFAEFDQVLETQGLWLKEKGQGMVITDGRYHVKAGDVSRELTGPTLEAKFDESLIEYVNQRDGEYVKDDVGLRLSADWKEGLDKSDLIGVEEILISKVPQMERRAKEMDELNKSYKQEIKKIEIRINKELKRTYENPFEAAQRITSFLDDQAAADKYAELEDIIYRRPEQFGELANEDYLLDLGKAFREIQKLQGEYGNYFARTEQAERDRAVREAKEKAQAKRQSLSHVQAQLQRQLQKGMEGSEAGRAISGSVNQSLSVYRSLQTMAKLFNDPAPRNKKLDRRMLRALKKINTAFNRTYKDSSQAKAFFAEIAWNDYRDSDNGIDHIAQLTENPERFGLVQHEEEVERLVNALRMPEKIRKRHHEFIEGIAEKDTGLDKVAYFKGLALQYPDNEQLVGGLEVAGELNKWFGMAAQTSDAGRALFKMSAIGIRSIKRVALMLNGLSKSRRAETMSVISSFLGPQKVRSLEQSMNKQKGMHCGDSGIER